jgi:hypothetical protein
LNIAYFLQQFPAIHGKSKLAARLDVQQAWQ